MSRFRMGQIALRLLVGVALLVAGLDKISDPATFASAIATFQILPAKLIPLTALSLPYFEIILAALLLTGWCARSAAFSATLLFAIYSIALAQGMARHLPIECDCFGTSANSAWSLTRDLVLLSLTAFLYASEIDRFRVNQSH
jgi:putative oxidoreductase